MNLLTLSPLLDSHGQLRYYLGAQVDVSGLVRSGTGLEAFKRLLKKENEKDGQKEEETKDEFRELSEMFNDAELETVRRFGSSMHREVLQDKKERRKLKSKHSAMFRDVHRGDRRSSVVSGASSEGGPYKHVSSTSLPRYIPSVRANNNPQYLIIRPSSTHRVLFTSSSLRVPNLLQSPFLDHVGGSARVRNALAEALADGTRGVTAKIRWLAAPGMGDEEGRVRWIHCTPLLGGNGAVGCWIVVLVDGDEEEGGTGKRRSGVLGLKDPPAVEGGLRVEKVRGKGKLRSAGRDEMAGLGIDGDGGSGVGSGWEDGRDGRGRRGKRHSLPLEAMFRSGSGSGRGDGLGEAQGSRPRSLVVEEKVERLGTPSSLRAPSTARTSVRSFGLG